MKKACSCKQYSKSQFFIWLEVQLNSGWDWRTVSKELSVLKNGNQFSFTHNGWLKVGFVYILLIFREFCSVFLPQVVYQSTTSLGLIRAQSCIRICAACISVREAGLTAFRKGPDIKEPRSTTRGWLIPLPRTPGFVGSNHLSGRASLSFDCMANLNALVWCWNLPLFWHSFR